MRYNTSRYNEDDKRSQINDFVCGLHLLSVICRENDIIADPAISRVLDILCSSSSISQSFFRESQTDFVVAHLNKKTAGVKY
ncbi:hypothetical protein J6590_073315 [Homalodisca vitripennis]|nr:hypothetical protein J6590_073315 [Homalodisca vitripennis]